MDTIDKYLDSIGTASARITFEISRITRRYVEQLPKDQNTF